MNKLTIGTLALFGSIVAGCGFQEPDRTKEVNAMFREGTTKVVSVKLAYNIHNYGPVRRFYDFDGDKKTVEQYVECYEEGMYSSNLKKVLVRPGFETTLNTRDSDVTRALRTMTAKEMSRLDREYQGLLEASRF